MQRLPLEKLPLDPYVFRTGFEKLIGLFGYATEPFNINSADAALKAPDYITLFRSIGFEKSPIIPRKAPRAKYPTEEQRPDKNHFLHWGAEILRMEHAIFEIGDATRIIRFDFKVAYTEYNDDLFYQLDELTLWDCDSRYSLNCDRGGDHHFIDQIIQITKLSVLALNNDRFDKADNEFSKLHSVVKALQEKCEREEHEHTMSWNGASQKYEP